MSMSRFSRRNDPFGLGIWNSIFDDAFRGRDPWGLSVQPSNAGSGSNSVQAFFKPKFDVEEGPNNTLKATFEVPGLKKEDINIELHRERLTISGQHTTDEEKKEENLYVRQRQFGKFEQTVIVPEGTKEEDIQASVADGLLTITFPKEVANKDGGPKKITVA